MHPVTADTLYLRATMAEERDALAAHAGHVLLSVTGYVVVVATGPASVTYFEVREDGDEVLHLGGLDRPAVLHRSKPFAAVYGNRGLVCETCEITVCSR